MRSPASLCAWHGLRAVCDRTFMSGGSKWSRRGVSPVGAAPATLSETRRSPAVAFLFGSAPFLTVLTRTASRRLWCGRAGRSQGAAGASALGTGPPGGSACAPWVSGHPRRGRREQRPGAAELTSRAAVPTVCGSRDPGTGAPMRIRCPKGRGGAEVGRWHRGCRHEGRGSPAGRSPPALGPLHSRGRGPRSTNLLVCVSPFLVPEAGGGRASPRAVCPPQHHGSAWTPQPPRLR